MSTELHDFVNVEEQSIKLDCHAPSYLAILPRNFETADAKGELFYSDSAIDIRKLWRSEGLEETRIEKNDDKFPHADEKNLEWIGPTIMIGGALWSQNPHAVSLAINIISVYVTDFFKGIGGDPIATLDIVVEQTRSKKYVRIHYEGAAGGIAELENIVRGVAEIE